MKQPLQNATGSLGKWRIQVKNTADEEIPPYGIMQIVGASTIDGDEFYQVAKPTGITNAKYLINSPAIIGKQEYGAGTDSYPTTAAYNLLTGNPVPGTEWGPIAGSWLLSFNGKGFLVLGGATTDTMRVAATAPGSTGGADVPIIYVRNDSGHDRLTRQVVGVGPTLSPPPSEFPVQPFHESRPPSPEKPFGILLGAVPAGSFMDTLTVGVVSVIVDIKDVQHSYAVALDGDYEKLGSASDGPAEILWREREQILGPPSLGPQWAMVALGHKRPEFPVVTIKSNFDNVPAHGVVKLGTPINLPPFQLPRKPRFNYGIPKAGDPFAITFEALHPGSLADAAVCGVVAVQIDVLAAGHKRADAIDGDNEKLRSGTNGQALILWKERQTLDGSAALGVQWCMVQLDNIGGPVLECTTKTIVTNVQCINGNLVVTTEQIKYVSAPCPN